jgi:allantoinase
MYDLIIRGGTVVTEAGERAADLAVADGQVAEVAPEVGGAARAVIDARGLHILAGGIDPHMHCNEPGRTSWEGFASATAALAAGGFTSMIDMPLNANPPTCDVAAFDQKLAAAQASAIVDFALWGGLVPGNLDDLDDLAERGVAGFKAFMSTTGTEDFQPADDLTLYQGMQRAARLGKIVAVHAENRTITDGLARQALAAGRTSMRDYLSSRPAVAEAEAILRAITMAEETGCRLHIVHVSTGRGVALVAEARARGVDVSCETCPHYLVLSDEDAERIGALAKCAPPLRDQGEIAALWQQIDAGNLTIVASDHSPAPPDMKTDPNLFAVWGGISGCQSTLGLLLSAGHTERGVPLTTITRLISAGSARRFGLWPRKGAIATGADADLALVDLSQSAALRDEDLHYRHRQSPYTGMRLRGRVAHTLVRGQQVVRDGQVIPTPVGRFLHVTGGA